MTSETGWPFLQGARLARSGALEYVEDFAREWTATMRDPEGRAALETVRQETQAADRERGGQRCCGTTKEWHRPWCKTGPRRFRETG